MLGPTVLYDESRALVNRLIKETVAVIMVQYIHNSIAQVMYDN